MCPTAGSAVLVGRIGAMRLVTFNILHGRSLSDDLVDVDRFARAVADLDADVLALQEVDRNQRRSGHVDLTQVAAEAMGAVEHRFVPTIDRRGVGGRAQYGLALLSRFPVHEWRVLPSPCARGGGLCPGARRAPSAVAPGRARSALAAVVLTPQGPLTVVTTHLSIVDGWGEHQLDSISSGLAGAPRPLVLLGDLNLRSEIPRRSRGGARSWSPGRIPWTIRRCRSTTSWATAPCGRPARAGRSTPDCRTIGRWWWTWRSGPPTERVRPSAGRLEQEFDR
ncbi:endonuclease/exonuclease/phosphatase family protein [Oerskovia sp. M15]